MSERQHSNRDAAEGELFRLLVENVKDYAIFILNPEGRVRSWNPGAEQLLGYSEGEIIGQPATLFFTPEDIQEGAPDRELTKAVQAGRAEDACWHVRKDGSRFWSSGTITPLWDAEHNLQGFAKIMRDRTSQKQSEDALKIALTYNQGMVDTVREPLLVLEGNLRVKTANRSFYQTFRASPAETEGRLIYHLSDHLWDIPQLRTLLEEILPQQTSFDGFEVEHEFGAIGRKVMLLNARRFSQEGGPTELILLAIEDITDRRRAEDERGEIETRFTSLVKNIKDHAIFTMNPDERITSWNVEAEHIMGYSEAEILDQPFPIIFTPEDIQAGKPELELRTAKETGRALDERWHIRKDGERFWALGIVTPTYDADGRHTGFSKILRDMTEEKLAEESLLQTRGEAETQVRERTAELRTAKERLQKEIAERWRTEEKGRRVSELLQAVADGTPDGVFVKDRMGRYLLLNKAAGQFVGRPVEEVLGRDDTAVFGPADARLVMDRDRRVMESGQAEIQEAELTAGGVTRTFLATNAPYRNAAGNVIGVLGISHDISDRKRIEAERNELLVRLQLQFERMPIAYILYDADNRYASWNPKAEQIFGYAQDEILGKSFLFLVPEEDHEQVKAIAHRLWAGDVAAHSVNRNVTKDGRLITCEWHNTPLFDPDGAFLGVLSMAIDVTDRVQATRALQASEERFRTLVAAITSIVWSTPASGEFETEQPGWTAFTGQTFDQLRGWGWLSAVHEDDRDNTARVWTAAVATRSVFEVEHRLCRADGECRYMSVRAVPILNPDGAIREWVGVHTDVHERRQAETERNQLLARLNLQIERLPLAYLLSGPDLRYTRWNPAAEKTFGFSEAEVLDRHPFEVIVPSQSQPLLSEIFERLKLGDMNVNGVSENVTRDGRTITCEWYNTPVMGEDGKFAGLISLAQDVSSRREAEKSLRLRDRAIQAITQGIIVTDSVLPDNPIVYASPSFLRLTGYRNEEVVGRNCRFLQGKDTDPASIARTRQAVEQKQSCTVELLNYRKDGTAFWNELSLAPVMDPDGRMTHFVGVQTDVTERRQLEDQFRQAQKMEAFGQLAGGVAHDFNNLLTVILGYSDLMLVTLPHDDRNREPIQEIHNAGERAALLTRQLLTFSRKQVVQLRILELNYLVANAKKMLERLIGENMHLTTVLPPDLDLVKVDPGQIEQVIMNLVVNARDAMPQGGKITIETANVNLDADYAQSHAEIRQGRYVLLAVSDMGCGMTEEVKAHVFEPFFTTKEVGKGTGLGLATVFGIVKQSGGHVRVYSEVGFGTTFKLYLPSVAEAVQGVKKIAQLTPTLTGSETIFLVEDEKAVREMTQLTLRTQGYTVIEAANGVEAISLCGRHSGSIHLLLTDVVMPHMGGQQLAERLTVLYPEMKVLFLSGYTDDAVVRHGILQETSHFLQKPFTPAALLQKVREILDSPSR